MALEHTPSPLDRAREAAGRAPVEGWAGLPEAVMSRVRAVVVPADPVLTFADGGHTVRDGDGSTTLVSTRVLRAVLRDALRQATYVPRDLDLTVERARLTGVTVDLVCSYGLDLWEVAEEARRRAHAELVAVIGPDPDLEPGSVTVAVVDVVVGDPRLV